MPRRIRSQKPPTLTEALHKLRECDKQLRTLGSLTVSQTRQIKDAVQILAEVQKSTKRIKYKIFLHEVLQNTGPGIVLLCAVGLGQAGIANMNESNRSELERQLRLPHGFDEEFLRSLALRMGVPESQDGTFLFREQKENANLVKILGQSHYTVLFHRTKKIHHCHLIPRRKCETKATSRWKFRLTTTFRDPQKDSTCTVFKHK